MKSSLEIALERADRIAVDPQSLASEEQLKTGRRLVALVLNQGPEALASHLRDLAVDNIKLGFVKSALTHFTLTVNSEAMERMQRMLAAFSIIEPAIESQKQTITKFFASYSEQHQSFTNQLLNQIESHLEQKSQAYYAKSGIQRAFTLQNDPELSAYYADEMKKFELYFSDHLKQHKWQLLQQLGMKPEDFAL